MTRQLLTIRNHRFLVGPWHDETTVAYLSLAPSTRMLPSGTAVRECVERLTDLGYTGAVTAALRTPEASAFSDAGFSVTETLTVLRHDLNGDLRPAERQRSQTRRAKGSDHTKALEVDRLAFDHFWHLGPDGLREALDATNSVRFRVIGSEVIEAFAICGRSLDIGYLQRLAVHPDCRRRGLASTLVFDALRWLRRRRGRTMLVNTQESNVTALAFYDSLGFKPVDDNLSVLSWNFNS